MWLIIVKFLFKNGNEIHYRKYYQLLCKIIFLVNLKVTVKMVFILEILHFIYFQLF